VISTASKAEAVLLVLLGIIDLMSHQITVLANTVGAEAIILAALEEQCVSFGVLAAPSLQLTRGICNGTLY
jgi:hypothetical protein